MVPCLDAIDRNLRAGRIVVGCWLNVQLGGQGQVGGQNRAVLYPIRNDVIIIPELAGLNVLSCNAGINHSRPIITKILGALVTRDLKYRLPVGNMQIVRDVDRLPSSMHQHLAALVLHPRPILLLHLGQLSASLTLEPASKPRHKRLTAGQGARDEGPYSVGWSPTSARGRRALGTDACFFSIRCQGMQTASLKI